LKKATWLVPMMLLAACVTPGTRTKVGAGAGAVTGAVVGGALGGWKGAAVGAVTGAVAGGAAGNLLDRQVAELKARDANASRTATGILVKLKDDLLFHTGSDVLKPEAVRNVAALAEVLKKYPQDRIEVHGYTDSTGPAVYNEELSMRRAEAVRKVLVQNGVGEAQALSMGLGESQPLASNATEAGRAQNRRVELKISVPAQG
jgi:outer membrane protein OmpA-like peptidoglycan-associated protein